MSSATWQKKSELATSFVFLFRPSQAETVSLVCYSFSLWANHKYRVLSSLCVQLFVEITSELEIIMEYY